MEGILIHPSRLTEFAARLRAAAREIQAVEKQLNRSFHSMDWETQIRSGMEGNVASACREASVLALKAEAMAIALEKTAELFTGADQTQSGGLDKFFAGFSAILALVLPSVVVSRLVTAVKDKLVMGSVLGATAGAGGATSVPPPPEAPAARADPYQRVADPGAFPGHSALTPDNVRYVQHVLGLPETGLYDEKTKAAVAQLQWEYRFQIDGINSQQDADGAIGPSTWRTLRAINHASGVDVKIAGHDMNTLITDEEFLNKDALSLDQVRDFLQQKNSILATDSFPVWRLADEDPGLEGAVKRTDEHGRTYWKYPTNEFVDPARLIYDAAQKHGINPVVLLTKLQKEQSLVTSYQWHNGEMERMDPTWVGTIVGMGFAVPDGGNIDTSKTGIDVQIEEAARRSVEMFNEEAPDRYPHVYSRLNYGIPDDFEVKGHTIPWALEVRNRATWVLYRYTPHIVDHQLASEKGVLGGGNYLFADIYDRYRKEVNGE